MLQQLNGVNLNDAAFIGKSMKIEKAGQIRINSLYKHTRWMEEPLSRVELLQVTCETFKWT